MRYYSKDHEWIEVNGETGKVGITDHAQAQLGELVFCEMEPPGTVLAAGDMAGAVESVKAAADILTPVSGEITAVNDALADDPVPLNTAPEENWLFTIRLSAAEELDALMDEGAYKVFCHE
ncbi:MAG: glycine cleavage system protein H [Oscillospiraceae bacterium]|jgi:glycine cleavage system H protein|nr:glycine cleavage system protein H [Oscillospiraceae bacterium]